MKTDQLDYDLPRELIAQEPLPQRSESRLLVVQRATGALEHRRFRELGDYLRPGDCLVVNESKVVPARFFVRRGGGGLIEGLFLEATGDNQWLALLRNASRLRNDEPLRFCDPHTRAVADAGPTLIVRRRLGEGQWLLALAEPQDPLAVLERFGITPLPPYIERPARADDSARYQTVYAREPGSAAAPTAGLHFSDDLLATLAAQGVRRAQVTLHVGVDTFKPVKTDDLEAHPMHAERYRLAEADAECINAAIAAGGRIFAVGSTSVRVLESCAQGRRVQPATGATRLFITPGYRFQVVDAIITNFHLPRTTLLAMVAAFAGTERILAAYREAVAQRYRFFSYGDATLLL